MRGENWVRSNILRMTGIYIYIFVTVTKSTVAVRHILSMGLWKLVNLGFKKIMLDTCG